MSPAGISHFHFQSHTYIFKSHAYDLCLVLYFYLNGVKTGKDMPNSKNLLETKVYSIDMKL